MHEPPEGSFDPSMLREALIRRMYRRSSAEGQLRVPAVPGLIDEYVQLCANVCATLGVWYTPEQSAQLRAALETELAKAFKASPRSDVVISYHSPFGSAGVNFRVQADARTIEADYEQWVAVRPPPLFGTEPDAARAGPRRAGGRSAAFRVLDVGAGTGRNALALARRGHQVDAVEMTAKFADVIRAEAGREALRVNVIQSDVFTAMEGAHARYHLMVLSEVVPDFRTPHELRGMFELAAECLAPAGAWSSTPSWPATATCPTTPAVQLGQQCNSMIFTREEVKGAAVGLPLEPVADDSAYEYEKARLPAEAWPPTAWFEGWATGIDVFDVERDDCPIELRWLVYEKAG
ncbi:tellurite resistance TehB family protein [Mycobacterium intracellulare 1956]|uniref:Tellurite resistance TehB family protein n=1 Tax=Mycobacterium intracellulare 1956 TaxID=1299331 RepID=X8CVD5_MYCIT|nr:tellurite resistance TehB family protein [Mycobacterium intracellulare 1956]